MAEAMSERCVSCGGTREGEFCPDCGERRITPSDRSVAAFLARAFEEVTDLDSRLFRTLRRLVFSPGYLTRAFAEGRRKPYLGPVQLFLLANLAYFRAALTALASLVVLYLIVVGYRLLLLPVTLATV